LADLLGAFREFCFICSQLTFFPCRGMAFETPYVQKLRHGCHFCMAELTKTDCMHKTSSNNRDSRRLTSNSAAWSVSCIYCTSF